MEKDGVLLDSDYVGTDGQYLINVCALNAGTGYYIVKTEKFIHGDKWACARSFYYNKFTGPWDFPIDLPLAYTIEKNSN